MKLSISHLYIIAKSHPELHLNTDRVSSVLTFLSVLNSSLFSSRKVLLPLLQASSVAIRVSISHLLFDIT